VDPRAFLESLTADEEVAPSLVSVRELPAHAPVVEDFPPDLPDLLISRLKLMGIDGLYPHQAEGLRVLREGSGRLVMATGTASGKTLIYNAAFAEAALTIPKATALYLYPTKALARDQLRAVRAMKIPQLKASVYDGDTPRAERPLIRKNANLVMTNPDMLHLSLLADHARWADFFFRLSLVVVDEAHVCRGVFGSHVALVLRRLRRLVAHYGGDPRWCLASATVGNPGELASRLTGLPTFDEVVDDASPRGRKLFALWNPPVLDEETGQRRSALSEASWMLGKLAAQDIRTIGFTRSRRAAELLAEFARREVGDAQKRAKITSYRAGYLAEDRRVIERQLADGMLLAVASTNALELGIDIGSLDAAVLVGYPGTRASMWQQAGRAGRRGGGLAVLIAQDDPLDQYLVQHPEDLFDRPAEAAVIDPTNPYVLEPHLRCAAREQPLGIDELSIFGPEAEAAVDRMAERGELARRGDRWHDRGREAPHRSVDVRAGAGHVYTIADAGTGEVIGTADESRSFGTLHPGAVYLHQGDQYVVGELNLVDRVALVSRADPDFYTQSRNVTDIGIDGALETSAIFDDTTMSFGGVRVTNQVTGYVKKLVATNEIVDEIPLALPPVALETRAVWWTIPQSVIDRAAVSPRDLAGAIHAAEHAAIGLLPLVATCDRWDVGGVSTPLHPDTGLTTIFVYDGYPGGAGIAERGYRDARRWLEATLETIRDCPCARGCPSCVQSPKCGNGNEPLDKPAATSLLAAILGRRWG
jgi:DEAD/DEAH box helicase domain-containing protein